MIAAADAWRTRDLGVLWHPCTQMREHPDVLPLVPIARGEGAWLVGRDGRRYLDAVSSWWTNLFGHAEPRIAAGHRHPGDDPGTRDPGRVLAPTGGRTGREAAGHRAATSRPRTAGQGVLCRQRLGRRGSRAEDGLPLVPQSRRGPAQQVRRAGERLPRRNHRRAVGRRHPAVPPRVRAAARRSAVRAFAGCLPVRARRVRRRPCQPRGRCIGRAARTPCRRDLRADPGATRAVRRRHAHARPAVPAPRPRALRCAWRVPDRRRDRGRLRSHRHDVRLRTIRRAARPAVPVEGADRRLPAAGRGAVHAGDLRRLPRRLARARLPAFAQLHRQSAGLRGGAGLAGDLRIRRRARAQPRNRIAHGRTRRAVGGPAARRRCPPGRDDRWRSNSPRMATGARRSTPRCASACAPIARHWNATWCCARSATRCTGCRRTASTTNNWNCLRG